MNGATRYTTTNAPRDALESVVAALLLQPATAPAIVLGVALIRLHVSHGVAAGTALGFWIAVSGALILKQQFGMLSRLRRTMTDLGLVYRDAESKVHSPRVRGRRRRDGHNLRVRWELPPGVTLHDLLMRQEALEHRCKCELVCWFDEGLLVMEVLGHRIPRLVQFRQFYGRRRPAGRLLVGLGEGRRGALWLDLATLPHLLVGGMTGGGKSVFLRQALTFLLLEQSPSRLRVVCIDLKGGVELGHLAGSPHALRSVVTSIEGAAVALDAVRVELDRRLSALRAAGFADVDAWLASGNPAWPRLLVVIDELAELTVRDVGRDPVAREAQKASCARLIEIARLGRAVGIHLIVCTQRPDAEAVPGQLKANLAGTVAFRVRAAVNSLILLDTDRAALLPHHPGRGLWAEDRIEEFQAVYLSADESRRLLHDRWGTGERDEGAGPVTPCPQTPESRDLAPQFDEPGDEIG